MSKKMSKKPPIYSVTGAISAYEDGLLEVEEVRELFQHLVDTGLAWTLQGHYGRVAMRMIEAGDIKERRK